MTKQDDHIWFDLCVGDAWTDDFGGSHYESSFRRMSQLSASNITNISKYRDMLHKLLDKAIDHIELEQKYAAEHSLPHATGEEIAS